MTRNGSGAVWQAGCVDADWRDDSRVRLSIALRVARTLPAMSAFPMTRLRRLRRTETLRALVRETALSLDDVVMPLFACPGEGIVKPVGDLHVRGRPR